MLRDAPQDWITSLDDYVLVQKNKRVVLLTIKTKSVRSEKWMGSGLMEPLEKMATMWCTRMPVRLGVNASHVGGDVWANTNASSPHSWWKPLRV